MVTMVCPLTVNGVISESDIEPVHINGECVEKVLSTHRTEDLKEPLDDVWRRNQSRHVIKKKVLASLISFCWSN